MTRLHLAAVLAGLTSGAWAALSIALHIPTAGLLALAPLAGLAWSHRRRAHADAPTVLIPRFVDQLDAMLRAPR
ncbi:hypothetical protein [Pseudonocardia sp.]|uniref:hypothetical protein n=1 Tax=Pseudonocardia sp. TaxID=60912 RepID=UPI003D0C1DF0